jgi:hypothetical protein
MGWPFVWFCLFWPRKINERPRGSGIKIKENRPIPFSPEKLEQVI